jgi:hypothetical protein
MYSATPRRPCLAILLLLVASAAPAAEPTSTQSAQAATAKPPIGRIFFSPAERRAARGASKAASANGVVPSERFSIDGAVSADAKGRAVWINEVPIDNSAAKKSAWTDAKGNVWFRYESLGSHVLRPGQSIDREGKIEDLLPPNAVTRH